MAKTDRIELRLSSEHKLLVEGAASLMGQSVSAFVLAEAIGRAHQITTEYGRTRLSRDDWDRFLEIMDRDAEPTPALKAAAKKYLTNRD